MTPIEYLADLQTRLITCNFISAFEVVEEWAQPDRGYVRMRIRLVNNDFVEVAEYFVFSGRICIPERYRYQWMDGEQEVLRRRWDNVEHYPNLSSFPHHVHLEDGRVEPGKCLSIMDLLDLLSEMDI